MCGWAPQVSPAGSAAGEGDFQRLGLAMAPPLGRAAEFLSDSLDDVQVIWLPCTLPVVHPYIHVSWLCCAERLLSLCMQQTCNRRQALDIFQYVMD